MASNTSTAATIGNRLVLMRKKRRRLLLYVRLLTNYISSPNNAHYFQYECQQDQENTQNACHGLSDKVTDLLFSIIIVH